MAMFIGTMMNLVVPSFQSNIEGTTTLRENMGEHQTTPIIQFFQSSSRIFQKLPESPNSPEIPRPLPLPDSPRFPSWAPLGCWDSASGPSHPAPRRRRCRLPRRPPAPWGVFHYKVWGIVELTIKIWGFSCKNHTRHILFPPSMWHVRVNQQIAWFSNKYKYRVGVFQSIGR